MSLTCSVFALAQPHPSVVQPSAQTVAKQEVKINQKAKLLILGDSLSAGYRLAIEKNWTRLLSSELQQMQRKISVINGSVSGDTTGNGLARLPRLLKKYHPQWVLIELGANDGLRGFSMQIIEKNLRQLIELSQKAGAKVILMQIHVPPNYGDFYSKKFAEIYPLLAKKYNVPLIPFYIKEILLKEAWIQKDGLHPNEKAQPWIAHFMAQQLAPHLKGTQ